MGLNEKLFQYRLAKVAKEKEAGAAFLDTNCKEPGVTVLPGGIQYRVLQEGTGKQPTAASTIKAHYRGSLLDGTEFDNSYKRGQPFVARLTALIRGWQQVLPLMPVGSKWRMWVPSDLAYGDEGVGQAGIPGGAVLEFDIELLEILH